MIAGLLDSFSGARSGRVRHPARPLRRAKRRRRRAMLAAWAYCLLAGWGAWPGHNETFFMAGNRARLQCCGGLGTLPATHLRSPPRGDAHRSVACLAAWVLAFVHGAVGGDLFLFSWPAGE